MEGDPVGSDVGRRASQFLATIFGGAYVRKDTLTANYKGGNHSCVVTSPGGT